jgi:hypothetical protein
MSVLALVRLEGDVNCIVTIDGVEYCSWDGGAFRAPDDTRVGDRDPKLADFLDELCEICAPHCSETEYLTALVDLNTLQITKMNVEEAPE